MATRKERKRVMVAVDVKVLAIFEEMAELSGMSLSRTIGEWLADTVEGAQYIAKQMADVKKSPGKVMRRMHTVATALQVATEDMLQVVEKKEGRRGPAGRAADGRSSPSAVSPPLSNTGGKVPKKPKTAPIRGVF